MRPNVLSCVRSCGSVVSGMNERVHEQSDSVSGEAPAALEHLRAAIDSVTRSNASTASVNALNGLLRSTSLEAVDRSERAALLLKLLAEPSFKGAVDDSGASGRATAVKALLELGYPFALQVHPDDLVFFRGTQKNPFAVRKWVIASVAVAAIIASVGAVVGVNVTLAREARARAQCAAVLPEKMRADWLDASKARLGEEAVELKIVELSRGPTEVRARELCGELNDPLY